MSTTPHPHSRKILTTKRLGVTAAVLTVGSMLLLASISYRTTQEYLKIQSPGTIRVQFLQEALSNLKEVEAAHHGFLLTGESSYLDSYNEACVAVNKNIARLRALAKQTDSVEAEQIDNVRVMVSDKLQEFGKTLQLMRDSGRDSAIQAVIKGDRENGLDRIRKFIVSIQADELSRQDEEIQAAKANATFHRHLTIGLVGIDVLLLLAFGFMGIKMNRLEHLVTVCAWSQKVEYEGEWMRFEEFLEKRFGVRCSHGISEEEAEKLFQSEKLKETQVFTFPN